MSILLILSNQTRAVDALEKVARSCFGRDIPQFGSLADAAAYADKNKLHVSSGQGELFGQLRDWIRLEYDDYWIHYEFRGDNLGLVTLIGV